MIVKKEKRKISSSNFYVIEDTFRDCGKESKGASKFANGRDNEEERRMLT